MSTWKVTNTPFATTDSQGYPLIYYNGSGNTLCLGGSFEDTDINITYSYYNVAVYNPSGNLLWADPLNVNPKDIAISPATTGALNADDYDNFPLGSLANGTYNLSADSAPTYWTIGGGPYKDPVEDNFSYHSVTYTLAASATKGIYHFVVTRGRSLAGYDYPPQSTLAGTTNIVANIPFDYEYPPITIVDNNFNSGEYGYAYNQETYTATGGDGGPYTWSDNGGLEALGLKIGSTTGTISGTPTSVYTAPHGYNVTLYATDSHGDTGSLTHTLDVSPAPLTVTASNKTMVLSNGKGTLPTLSCTVTGFVNGNTQSTVFTSGSPSLSTTATSTSPAGSYPITVAQGTWNTPANYTLTFVNGTLTVSNAPISLYSVTYNSNGATGGTVPVDSNSYSTGSTVHVLDNSGDLVKTLYYAFGGWNTAANGSGQTYQANSTFTMGSANVNLYAIWIPDEPTLSLTGSTLPPLFEGIPYTMQSITVYVDAIGGIGPYTYNITGYPVGSGTFSFDTFSTDSTYNELIGSPVDSAFSPSACKVYQLTVTVTDTGNNGQSTITLPLIAYVPFNE
jgi:hypothetical protein